MALTSCNVEDLVNHYPCLNCLSETQLRQALLYLWTVMAGYTLPDDLEQIKANCVCTQCLDRRKVLIATISAFAQFLDEFTDMPDVLENAKCLQCLTAEQANQLIACVICDFLKLGP